MISKISTKVAKFLEIPKPKSCTGHCFRRNFATLLANTAADMISLKWHSGWKSSTIAKSYSDDSLQNTITSANRILGYVNEEPSISGSVRAPNFEKTVDTWALF